MDWQPVWGVPRLSPCGSLDRLHPPTTLMRIIGGDGWILGQRKALLSLLGLSLLLPQVTWQKQQLVEETVLTADRSMFFCTKWVAFHQVSVDSVYIVFCACGLSRETKTFIVERDVDTPNVTFQILSSTPTASLLTDPWIEESGKPFGFCNFWCSIYSTADTG